MRRVDVGRGAQLSTVALRRRGGCSSGTRRQYGPALGLALFLAAIPRGASAEGIPTAERTANAIDFGAGFQGRMEPIFTRESVIGLFAVTPALTAPLFAPPEPNEPAFARAEAHSLFASRADALSGETTEPTPLPEPIRGEPGFTRPEVDALFVAVTSLAAEPDPSPTDTVEGPVFTRQDVATLFADAAGAPLGEQAEPAEEERRPVFARPEVATLFERLTALPGDTAEIEVTPPEPVFSRPEIAALFEGRTAPLGDDPEMEAKPAEPIFARAEVTGLFLARTEELAAELPDAPSPKAARAMVEREPASDAPALGDGPSMTGSLGADADRPSEASRRTAPAVTTASLGQPKRIGGGRAVWYEHPGRTASGEIFDPDGMTAGHRTLPLGTRVRVVNVKNGRSVVVRINDRGPVQKKFEIDLSRGSARVIGVTGVSAVEMYATD